jgi:hypothetical protein
MTKLVYKYQEKAKGCERALLLVEYNRCASDVCQIDVIGASGVLLLGPLKRALEGGRARFDLAKLPDGDLELTLVCGARTASSHGLYKSGGAVYPKLLGIDGIGGLEARICELENEVLRLSAAVTELDGRINGSASLRLGE